MAHFQLEHELQSALRMDTAIQTTGYNRGRRAPLASCAPLNNSSILNRSQSETRLHSQIFANKGMAKPRARSKTPTRNDKTPTRNGNSFDSFRENKKSLSVSAISPSRMAGADRYIINRSTTDMDLAHHLLKANTGEAAMSRENSDDSNIDQLSDQLRRQKLSDVLYDNRRDGDGDAHRILSFSNKAVAPDETHSNTLKVLYSTGKTTAPSAKKTRQVTSHPEKILDAPDLRDEFYAHLIDWSSTNHLGVVLGSSCFVWNASDGGIKELFARDEDDILSAISWAQEGAILAASDSGGNIELWDANEEKFLRRMFNVDGERSAVLTWNDYILAGGSAGGSIQLHDVRQSNHRIQTLEGHSQEVCGLAWSHDGNLLASGANDNLVLLWDKRNMTDPIYTFNQHQSAIKAISWCPWHSNTLATGGGTSDRTIKFWNVANGQNLNSVNSGSQVSSLVWNAEYRELLSGHGFSNNQLTVWKYPQMTKVADLKGHTCRVLRVVASPDGTMVASAAGDETIRLWKVWPKMNKSKDAAKSKAKETGKLLSQRVIR